MALAQEISAAYSVLCGLRGEMAQFCCEQDIDRMEEMSPEEFIEDRCPIYAVMVKEAERRGLKVGSKFVSV